MRDPLGSAAEFVCGPPGTGAGWLVRVETFKSCPLLVQREWGSGLCFIRRPGVYFQGSARKTAIIHGLGWPDFDNLVLGDMSLPEALLTDRDARRTYDASTLRGEPGDALASQTNSEASPHTPA